MGKDLSGHSLASGEWALNGDLTYGGPPSAVLQINSQGLWLNPLQFYPRERGTALEREQSGSQASSLGLGIARPWSPGCVPQLYVLVTNLQKSNIGVLTTTCGIDEICFLKLKLHCLLILFYFILFL